MRKKGSASMAEKPGASALTPLGQIRFKNISLVICKYTIHYYSKWWIL
jgi:hypothetical protein